MTESSPLSASYEMRIAEIKDTWLQTMNSEDFEIDNESYIHDVDFLMEALRRSQEKLKIAEEALEFYAKPSGIPSPIIFQETATTIDDWHRQKAVKALAEIRAKGEE